MLFTLNIILLYEIGQMQYIFGLHNAGISVGMRPANERCRYIVRMSLIGWRLPRLIPDYGY